MKHGSQNPCHGTYAVSPQSNGEAVWIGQSMPKMGGNEIDQPILRGLQEKKSLESSLETYPLWHLPSLQDAKIRWPLWTPSSHTIDSPHNYVLAQSSKWSISSMNSRILTSSYSKRQERKNGNFLFFFSRFLHDKQMSGTEVLSAFAYLFSTDPEMQICFSTLTKCLHTHWLFVLVFIM